jgi:hypothetical protein
MGHCFAKFRTLMWTETCVDVDSGTGRGQDEARCALQIHTDVEGAELGDDWVARFQAAVAGLLQDDAYAARCAAARLVPRLCPLFPDLEARPPALVMRATMFVARGCHRTEGLETHLDCTRTNMKHLQRALLRVAELGTCASIESKEV